MVCKVDELFQNVDVFIKNDLFQWFGFERGFGNGIVKEDEDCFFQK